MPGERPLHLTNTMGRRLEEFQPIEPGKVRMYTCGPTVYSYAHIGNFRSFIMADTLRRVLEYNGYEVTHARNITDVGHLTNEDLESGEDRMERASAREHRTPWEIADFYTRAFIRDAERLNLLTPTFTPRATEYIEPMISLAARLQQSGHAYTGTPDLYFDVQTFPEYGKLSGNTVAELVSGHREIVSGERKRSPADFALWRGQGPEKPMRWESPWGEGVPGWHLECSAMAFDLLGEQIDIHTGGVDNIFPHHEDEIAQSESASGKQFSRYWVHSQWLQLAGGEKMSKSLGNIITVDRLEERGVHPLAYRYFLFQAHYRTPIVFGWDAVEAAQTALQRIWETAAELHQAGEPGEICEAGERFRERFHAAINRDMNMSDAVAVLHEALGAKLPGPEKLALLSDFDRVLGLRILGMAESLSSVTDQQRSLLDARAEARAAKDWARSDELRAQLSARGLDVKDTPSGQRWVRRDLLLPASQRETEHAADDRAKQ